MINIKITPSRSGALTENELPNTAMLAANDNVHSVSWRRKASNLQSIKVAIVNDAFHFEELSPRASGPECDESKKFS